LIMVKVRLLIFPCLFWVANVAHCYGITKSWHLAFNSATLQTF
jgi:hypothetical protein